MEHGLLTISTLNPWDVSQYSVSPPAVTVLGFTVSSWLVKSKSLSNSHLKSLASQSQSWGSTLATFKERPLWKPPPSPSLTKYLWSAGWILIHIYVPGTDELHFLSFNVPVALKLFLLNEYCMLSQHCSTAKIPRITPLPILLVFSSDPSSFNHQLVNWLNHWTAESPFPLCENKDSSPSLIRVLYAKRKDVPENTHQCPVSRRHSDVSSFPTYQSKVIINPW